MNAQEIMNLLLEYCVQVQGLQGKTDGNKLQQVQQAAGDWNVQEVKGNGSVQPKEKANRGIQSSTNCGMLHRNRLFSKSSTAKRQQATITTSCKMKNSDYI